MKLWKGEKPTVEDFLKQLEEPFQLALLLEHLATNRLCFNLSKSEVVVAPELVRTDMTTRSACEAIGVDADTVLQEISRISENVSALRTKMDQRGDLNKNLRF